MDRIMRFFQISILLLTACFASAEVIVDEGFEDGVVPPVNWQVWEEGETGCSEWGITIMSPHSGTYCAYHSDSYNALSDSWLVTDTYDLSTSAIVTYSFWRDIDYSFYYVYTGFWYSLVENPTSSDFTEMFELGKVNNVWEEFSGDISAECGGEQYVTFAWVYNGGYNHAERIDDFILEAEGTALERNSWGAIKSAF
jgi:hypothetical protein